jgi:uncharacterized protein (TIGR02996 family)
MTERDRLLHAVLDEPAEDVPRLVYADWLDDHGGEDDRVRAEFIRAGVELARMDETDPDYPPTLARSRRASVLAQALSVPWVDQVPGATVWFRRGFISRASISADRYLHHPSVRWRAVPLEELVLSYTLEEVGAALAARPELSRLRRLGLDRQWSVTEAAPLLTGCPHLTGLRELYLDGLWFYGRVNEESALTVHEIAPGLDLPAVEALSIRGGSPLHWPVLVPAFRRPLRRLILESRSYPDLEEGTDAYGWLVGSHHWPTLRQVNLWHTIITLRRNTVHDTPRLPNFAGNFPTCPAEDLRLSVSDLPNLAAQPAWGSLRTLRVSHGNLTEDLVPLARAPQAAQLQRLFLDYPDGPANEPGGSLPAVLVRRAHLAGLRHLRIEGDGYCTGDVFFGIVSGPYREQLLRLDLDGLLKAGQVEEVASRPWPELRTLRLGLERPEDLGPLLAARQIPNLCTLIVRCRSEVPETVIQALAHSPSLPHLSLVVEGRREWVLGGGAARKANPHIRLLETDLLEDGSSW